MWVGIGNMTDDPGRRYTSGDVQITSFSIAINKPGGRDREAPPLYVDVECWEKLAEQVYENGRKGRKVYVQGELIRDEWMDKDTEKKRFSWKVRAFVVRWLDANPNRSDRDDNDRGRGRDDDRGRDRDDRGRRDTRDSRDDRGRDERPRRDRDEEPRSRSSRDDEPLPTDNRDQSARARDERPRDDDRASRSNGRTDDPF